MTEVTTTGYVDARGVLVLRNRARVQAQLKRLPKGDVLVTIERALATRSASQNAYWWGVCVELVSEHTGYTPEEVHELAKAKFLPRGRMAARRHNGILVDKYVIGGSTRKLTKSEFAEFIERFREWAAADLDVVIPDPEAQDYDDRAVGGRGERAARGDRGARGRGRAEAADSRGTARHAGGPGALEARDVPPAA